MRAYTLEDALEAKSKLIELGLNKEEDFGYADEMDIELGYLLGEPLMFFDCDDVISAIDAYAQYLESIDEKAINDWEDFHLSAL